MDKINSVSAAAPPLTAVLAMGGLLDLYKQKEGLELTKLENVPAEKIEARAKAEGIWQSGISPHKPISYDLVTFSPEGNQGPAQIGIVAGTKKDGALQVITKISSETESVPSSGILGRSETTKFSSTVQDVNLSQIRGVISKPIPKIKTGGQNTNNRFMKTLGQSLAAHQNLMILMEGLLKPDSSPASKE